MKIYPEPFRFVPVIFLCLLLLRLCSSGWAHSDQEFEAADHGSKLLAGAILQSHPYLLVEDQREWLRKELRLAEQNVNSDILETEFALLLQSIEEVAEIDATNADASLTSPIRVFHLPGDRGGILFKVLNGAGPTCYDVVDLDLALSEKTVSVPVASAGTTWVLLSLSHVPDGATHWYVSFDSGANASRTIPIRIQAPQTGRLVVDILSDDTGLATPALVQLKWLYDGSERAPGSVVDYTLQFDSQSRTSERPQGARWLNLPGIEPGHYWICSGPFDMALPPGDWQITLLRGIEHLPVVDRFSIRSGSTTEKSYRPKRWINMADRGWYSGDDHVHMQIQSDADADRLLTWARATDTHLLNVLEMGDHERTFFQQRAWGDLGRTQIWDTVLVPGQEDPRIAHLGHTIGLNISRPVRDTSKYYLHDWMYDRVHDAGGLYGYAHVNRGLFFIERDLSLNVPKGKVDFVELLQFHHLGTDLYYRFLNLGEKMTASAGSDVPWGGGVGEVRVYAYLGETPFSADAWFDALENGRTFVTNGPMIEFSVNEALPGDQIDLNRKIEKLRVKAHAWGHSDRASPVRLEVVRLGEVIQTAKGSGTSGSELELDFEIDAGNGCWLAARVYAGDGSVAHTTPIYVKQPKLRFWKHSDVPDIIDLNLKSLGELEVLAGNIGNGEAMDAKKGTGSLAGAWYARPDRVRAKEIDFYDNSQKTWGKNRPKQSSWSARWQGILTVPKQGPLPDALYLSSSGASTLVVDDHVLIKHGGGGGVKANTILEPGKSYRIILDYQHLRTPLAYLHLSMSWGDGEKTPIPNEWLSYTEDDYRNAYRNGLGSFEEQRTLGTQAPALIERINETRQIYDQLRAQWEQEKTER